jgi:acyl dehydratase
MTVGPLPVFNGGVLRLDDAQVGAEIARVKEEADMAEGPYLEDFAVGRVRCHPRSKHLTPAECSVFTTWTMNANPLYYDAAYAQRLGHPRCPANPVLLMNSFFNLTLEDLPPSTLEYLGYWNLVFHRPVYPGAVLFARSEVLDVRPNDNLSDGIVHLKTTGTNEHGETVVTYERKIRVQRRRALGAAFDSASANG